MDLVCLIFILIALKGFLRYCVSHSIGEVEEDTDDEEYLDCIEDENVPHPSTEEGASPTAHKSESQIPDAQSPTEGTPDNPTYPNYRGSHNNTTINWTINAGPRSYVNFHPTGNISVGNTLTSPPKKNWTPDPTYPVMSHQGSHNTTTINWTINAGPGSYVNFQPTGNISVGNTPPFPPKKNWLYKILKILRAIAGF
jgi:hypothetical protein